MGNQAIINSDIASGVSDRGYEKVGTDIYFGAKQNLVVVPGASNLSVLMPAQIPVFTNSIEDIKLELEPGRSTRSVSMKLAIMSGVSLTMEQLRSLPR